MTVETLLWSLGSAGLGAFIGVVAFRTRMALIEDRQARMEKTLTDVNISIRALERRLERRQIVQLEILANIAKALKIDARIPDDLLTRFLTAGDD